jgi:hypothetical protein
MFFAYDEPGDWEPLVEAAGKLKHFMRLDRHQMYVYILIGFNKDTKDAAIDRCRSVKELGMCPFAMLYDNTDPEWQRIQRDWSRPALIYRKKKGSLEVGGLL